jgi:hypothetical protein
MAAMGTGRRLTPRQAADQLGVSVEAVRGRIKRGTIAHERDGGRVFVILDADQTATGHDQGGDQSELVAVLREQLAAEREANRENRRIIIALTSRVPELEASREPPQSPTPSPQASEGASTTPDPVGTQAATQPPQDEPRRSWWRRMFGG